MRLQKKSLSRVSLLDLLRRKRTSLVKFLDETGITTYELLLKRCDSMGTVPPTREEFLAVKGNPAIPQVSSPTEGVVVLQPPPDNKQQKQIEQKRDEKAETSKIENTQITDAATQVSSSVETVTENEDSAAKLAAEKAARKKKPSEEDTKKSE